MLIYYVGTIYPILELLKKIIYMIDNKLFNTWKNINLIQYSKAIRV